MRVQICETNIFFLPLILSERWMEGSIIINLSIRSLSLKPELIHLLHYSPGTNTPSPAINISVKAMHLHWTGWWNGWGCRYGARTKYSPQVRNVCIRQLKLLQWWNILHLWFTILSFIFLYTNLQLWVLKIWIKMALWMAASVCLVVVGKQGSESRTISTMMPPRLCTFPHWTHLWCRWVRLYVEDWPSCDLVEAEQHPPSAPPSPCVTTQTTLWSPHQETLGTCTPPGPWGMQVSLWPTSLTLTQTHWDTPPAGDCSQSGLRPHAMTTIFFPTAAGLLNKARDPPVTVTTTPLSLFIFFFLLCLYQNTKANSLNVKTYLWMAINLIWILIVIILLVD